MSTVYNFPENKEGQPLLQVLGNDVNPAENLLQNSLILHRPAFAHVQVNLNGNKIVAKAGAMLWMDSKVKLTATCHGGVCASQCRTCAQESFCQNVYSGTGEVAFGFDLPGDILPFAVVPNSGWLVSAGSFICSTENVVVSARFGGCAVCLCSGEGPFLTHVSATEGKGVFFAGNYGAIQRHDIPAGKRFCVSTGLFFACSDKTAIQIGLAGGLTTCLCGGEGFVMKFTGPCVVYTQNRDAAIMYSLLNPVPKQQPGKTDSGLDAAAAAM